MIKIADSHSDFLARGVIDDDEDRLYDHADLQRMQQGGVALQVFAVWVPPDTIDKLALGLKQIDYYHTFIKQSHGVITPCLSTDCLKQNDGIHAILAIESGESIDCRNDYIAYVYNQGARLLSLTWNGENDYASGCHESGGLKPRGIEAIHILNDLCMALDVSHLNDQGFWEALDLYEHAPCATHSCVYELNPVPRNLKRQQIDCIIQRKGYIGINFYTEFLRGGSYATIDDVLDHIEYVLDCGGEDAAGFGSDFCGIQYTPEGLSSVADFQKLPQAMIRRGYSDSLISKICYGNFASFILKFLKQKQGV